MQSVADSEILNPRRIQRCPTCPPLPFQNGLTLGVGLFRTYTVNPSSDVLFPSSEDRLSCQDIMLGIVGACDRLRMADPLWAPAEPHEHYSCLVTEHATTCHRASNKWCLFCLAPAFSLEKSRGSFIFEMERPTHHAARKSRSLPTREMNPYMGSCIG
ncbi:hypothetical protein CEXT_322851 [Caerostris extrusa]|uniref:Uncharacterized protein n=1 Tax=Caerostris extrusa TaxID=172846 RepID=A0AAV4Y8V1_CAEEX|nr:hypothetical protein CEXT_322851 [Caerostris extrusa]